MVKFLLWSFTTYVVMAIVAICIIGWVVTSMARLP